MALISFVFVWRGLSHTHRIGDAQTQTMAEFYSIDGEDDARDRRGRRVSPGTIMAAETESVSGHRHRIEVLTDVRHPDEKQPDRHRQYLEKRSQKRRLQRLLPPADRTCCQSYPSRVTSKAMTIRPK